MAFLRYQTVRNVGLGVLGAGVIVGIPILATRGGNDPAPTPPPAPPATAQPLTPTPTPPKPVAQTLDDAAIVARADQPANPGEKIKDAFKGHPTKVNLYEETQDRVYDRLKIDANRDDVWDQQWTRDATGRWKREDGMLFVGGQWLAEAPTPTPTPTPQEVPPTPTPEVNATPTPTPTPAPAPAEPYAAQLATVAKVMLEERATSEKIKDYFRGNGPKVNIYDDDKDGRWDRAKVDYDRDEVDDDKLTVKSGYLERKTEKTGLVRVWDNGTWRTK